MFDISSVKVLFTNLKKFRNSIRLCIGRQNTLDEIEKAVITIGEKINLFTLSPHEFRL